VGGDRVHFSTEQPDPVPIGDLGADDLGFQDQPFRIHQRMSLPTANLLAAYSIAARFAAYPGCLGRLRIDYSCAGLWVSSEPHLQAFTQRCVEPLEGSIYAPPPKPPVDALPRREVAGQKPPKAAALWDVEDGV
jgi:hypothetical protein